MNNPPRQLRSDTLSAHLPCGGEMWLTFMEGMFAAGEGDVNVAVFPHVRCPLSYANGKGCPWLDRLRKLHSIAKGLEEVAGYGKEVAPEAKPHVEQRDRVVRHVHDNYTRGFAITPDGLLYDRYLRPKAFEEPYDVFCNCQQVKPERDHKGVIIPFLNRLSDWRKSMKPARKPVEDSNRRNETMSDTIEVHKGYRLVGEQRGMPAKFCWVVGRQGSTISLLLVSSVATAEVEEYGREFAKVKTPDGVYNLMTCNEAKTDEDFEGVIQAIDGE